MPRVVSNKQKLTSLTVTKLRPIAKPYLVWDSYQRGLALQIQPSGYRGFKPRAYPYTVIVSPFLKPIVH